MNCDYIIYIFISVCFKRIPLHALNYNIVFYLFIFTGAMVWYQKFEYAVSHWLQKAAEDKIGCVLCSPGCFSLFRGSALMDDNVMNKYTTPPTEPRHYVQYDQGNIAFLFCNLMCQE